MAACELSHTDEPSQDRIAEYLLLARALASDDRFEDALGMLEQLERLAASGKFPRIQIQVAIAHSVALWLAGRRKAALPKLEHALRLAEPQGYVRSFIDEGPAMAEMLAELMESGSGRAQPVSKAYVRRLLNAAADEPLDEMASKPALTAQETKVLALMAEGLVNKEIAHRLEITVETVKFHIKNAYRKLGANNRVQAVQRARQWDMRL